MRCIAPFTIKVPVKPRGSRTVHVPCGKCPACLTRKRNDLVIRMQQEIKHHAYTTFLTLTYEDDNLYYLNDEHPSLCPAHLTSFWKSLRKLVPRPLRYFAIGEYGPQTYRPHYHAIVFGLQPSDYQHVKHAWPRGNVVFSPATGGNIGYMANFHIIKNNNLPDEISSLCLPEFTRYSNKPGIGAQLTSEYIDYLNNTGTARNSQAICSVPAYYKKKFFKDTTRLKMKHLAIELQSKPFTSKELQFANARSNELEQMRQFRRKSKKNKQL